MTSGEKQNYAVKRAREFKKAGLSSREYIPILAKLLQCSERQIRRYLPDDLKDQLQQERASGGQMSTANLIPQAPTKYSFLNGPLWSVAYRRLGKDKLLELLDKVANQYSTIKKTVNLDPIEEEKVLARAQGW